MQSTRRTLQALRGALLVLVLTACGSAPGASGGCSDREERRLAGDPDATPAQLVECGSFGLVAVSGDRRLVTFRLEAEDDELPSQGAWRMYDEAGETVAQGTLGRPRVEGGGFTLHAAPDGFVLAYDEGRVLHLDPEGAATDVPTSVAPVPVGAGGIVLGGTPDGSSATSWYDPATRQVHALPQPPFRADRLVLDPEGVLWAIRDWRGKTVRLASSAGGRPPWRESTLTIGNGSSVSGLWVLDGGIAVSTSEPPPGEGRLDGLYSRPAGDDPAPWRAHDLTGITGRTLDTQVLSHEGRIVVAAPYAGIFAETPAGGFEGVRLPEHVEHDGQLDAGYLTRSSAGLWWTLGRGDLLWHAESLEGPWTGVAR